MRKSKQNPCERIIKKHGWIRGDYEEKEVNHDWAYYNPRKRKCLKCNKIEVMTSYGYSDGFYYENWDKGLEENQ